MKFLFYLLALATGIALVSAEGFCEGRGGEQLRP